MEKQRFFAYSWHVDEEEEEITAIRIYGLNDKNENVCVRVNDFMPYAYIELPDRIPWDQGKAQLIGNKIDEIMGRQKPLRKELLLRKKLYGAHLDKHGKYKKFPYLFCAFSTRNDIKAMTFRMRKQFNVVGIGSLKVKIHETDANEILQLTCCRNLPTAGWIDFIGKRQNETAKLTLCHHEFIVKWDRLTPHKSDTVAKPKIMGFDIEVNSTNPTTMPKAERPGDKVFQISCVLCRHGEREQSYEKHLLTLGQPDLDVVGDDVLVSMFDTEAALLEGFTEFIREENPNVIVGYNILGFDIPYMIERAKHTMTIFNFDKQGFHKYAHAKERTIKWSSSAYKNQEFQFLDAEGRVFVDLLPLVKRDFKFNNYKLKTIAEHFVGQTKDPLSPQGIFKCYRLGMKRNDKHEYGNVAQRAMGIVGRYCVQDSALVLLLLDKLQTWVGLTEMAKTCNVPIFVLYTQGQQIKVYSQMYKYCMDEYIVVEKDAYQVGDNERYVGAHVFPPKPGRYNNVVPFDFASLYPTTIIAYNIDYHTWVPDDSDIPDSMCHVMSWEDHIGCIVEGSKITVGEYSILIENLENYQGLLLGYNDEKMGMDYYKQTNFFNQGVKDCIRLIFEDGTELCCTPDHKIMTENGWLEAQNIPIKSVRVFTSYCPPVFEVNDRKLVFDDIVFYGEKLIKFYKILGLLCSDSHISHNRTKIYCGHKIDLQNLINDLEDLYENSYSVRKENYGWGITILGKLGKLFRNLEGMILGNKHIQYRSLPTILEKSSVSELSAFLSGLFGGDGHTFSYSEKSQSIGTISLSWTSETPEELSDAFLTIQKYLKLVDINSSIQRYKNKTYLHIKSSDILKYKEYIGFSYCVRKSMRLELGYSYLKLRNNVWEQQKWLVERVKILKKTMTINEANNKAIEELWSKFPIYNEYYAKPSVKDMIELLRPRKKWEKPMFSYKMFPTFPKYIDNLGAGHIFQSYGVDYDKEIIPIIYKQLIHIEYIGKKQVYDLEVNDSHSFIANSFLVHNCCHDPKVIRVVELTKYIDSEKEVIKKMREKKNAIKNKVLKKEMQDEIDKKVEELKPYTQERSDLNKSKPKNPMCAKRYYRFLKEPRGVLPTIIQNLLDARKHTRKVDMKNINSKIKELEAEDNDHSKEITELKSLIGVLDKRQLAYKVSANSMYGAMGVRRGYLPFMPGAMCTTYMGRTNIELVAKTIVDKHSGELIYGDTDSNYIHFPTMEDKSTIELWDYAEYVAEEVTKLFPAPINFGRQQVAA